MQSETTNRGRALYFPVLIILLIWAVYVLDLFLPLEQFGLVPRTLSGIVGIAGMTFLHGSMSHLLSNSLPLLVLLYLLISLGVRALPVIVSIVLTGGGLLWLLGRGNSSHIGASLLVFGLITFLISRGFLQRRTRPLMISLVVLFVYGGTILSGIMPWQRGVSWEGHLFGGVAGVVTAWLMREPRSQL